MDAAPDETVERVCAVVSTALVEMNVVEGPDGLYERVLGDGGLDLDSLSIAEIMAVIEGEFRIPVMDAEIEGLSDMTVGVFAREVAELIVARSRD